MVKYNTMYRVAFVQLSSRSVYCCVTVVLLSCYCRVTVVCRGIRRLSCKKCKSCRFVLLSLPIVLCVTRPLLSLFGVIILPLSQGRGEQRQNGAGPLSLSKACVPHSTIRDDNNTNGHDLHFLHDNRRIPRQTTVTRPSHDNHTTVARQ